MTTSPPRPRAKTRPAARPDPGARPAEQNESRGPAAVVTVKRLFAAETGSYFLLLGTTLFLVVFGLVMVLSSSAVESFKASGDFFNGFVRQVLFAAIGVPLMLISARLPAFFWKKWAGRFLVIAIGLQLLVFVPHIGVDINGNRNWINIGGFTAQPSELIKVALVLWLGKSLSGMQDRLDDWRELVKPLIPAGIAIGLVVLGGDIGTAIILLAIVFATLFFAGVSLRLFAIPLVALAIAGSAIALGSGSRASRIAAVVNGCKTDTDHNGLCWQTVHGWWALASGGIFGVGLGNSKLKWSWLPEADNDFIFAIIGEELGLIGAILVLVLLLVLAITFVRIIRARPTTDAFARVAVSAVLIWVIGQAFVNIAVVLGLLPVLGVPLPLISAGGSALVTTLLGIGIVLSFARHAPNASPTTATGGRLR
ncbi:putative lipid II flippase FtsW [Frigoribacterium sp. UYMn621]|uniref:putative lipid II flippase FtsW n=1 Tax=Frigoribacterium sp. UYMn621 TaxID=3156343 RepID=UPI00339AA2E1